MKNESIIVIGGGAAGLMAAKDLVNKYDVIILEASSRLGGRIWSKPSTHSSKIIEAGAEFIHGHQKITLELLKEAGIKYAPVEGKMYHKEKGKLEEQTEMIEGWDELLKQMKKVKTDMTMHDFLQEYFGNDEQADLRRHATYYAEGFDLADVKKASVQSLYKEWSNEEYENFRIQPGYSSLIDFLKKECERKGCDILANKLVKQIDWEKNTVTVYTNDGQKYFGNKVIVTVPLAVLKRSGDKRSINFTPPLDEYIQAANEIGMGAVIKVVLQFHRHFWKEDIGFIFSEEIFPTWWTQLPDNVPVLSGWAGSIKAEQLSGQSDEQILEKAILSLSSIFEISHDDIKNNLQEANVFNWQGDELGLYGYSYNTLNTFAARQLLNMPVEQTIFFTGEGLYAGNSPGTVEAALASGKEVAVRV